MLHAIDTLVPPLTADLQAQLVLDFPQRILELAGARQAVRECGAGRRRMTCGPSRTGRSYL